MTSVLLHDRLAGSLFFLSGHFLCFAKSTGFASTLSHTKGCTWFSTQYRKAQKNTAEKETTIQMFM